nr:cysteine-rich receptor-like protein kinase [Tanacetum cinerariifolium]
MSFQSLPSTSTEVNFARLKFSSTRFKTLSNKALRPDGFTFHFVMRLWEVLGPDITNHVWRKWFKGCLNTSYTSVLVNGSPTQEFKVRKGTRQKDPISPFLFLIVAEALSVSIEEATKGELTSDSDNAQIEHVYSWLSQKRTRKEGKIMKIYDLEEFPPKRNLVRCVKIVFTLCGDYLCGYHHLSRVHPIVNVLAGRLLGAYDLGVATPKAVVHAGNKISGDAMSLIIFDVYILVLRRSGRFREQMPLVHEEDSDDDFETPVSYQSKQTSNALHNVIIEAGGKDHPPMSAPGINNDIYSIVDACPNACKIRKAIKMLKQGKSINVQDLETNVYWKFGKFTSRDAIEMLKQGKSINVQDLETNLYWKFGKFTSRDGELLESYYSRFYKMINELVRNQCDVTNHQHQSEVNEIKAERLARTANPLALVAQQPVYHPQNHPTHYTQNSSTRSQQAATRNRGKSIVNSPPPIYDQEPTMVAEDDEMSKDKEIDKLMALISLSFNKIYKPTNNNLRTSSNTSSANQGNSLRVNRGTGYDNQRIVNVAGARENVADWRDDTDDELDDQELEAHYMYMEKLQEVTPDDADNFGPIFDTEPLQKVSKNDNYNVFAIKSEHPEQSKSVHDTYPIEKDEHNVIIDSLNMSYDREHADQDDADDLANERDLLASLIETKM